jgi:uncharacterized protein DUF4191
VALRRSKGAAKTKEKKPKEPGKIRQAYKLAKSHNKRVGLILLAWFFGCLIIVGGPLWLLVNPIIGVALGVLVAFTVTMWIFGRRVERAGYAQLEGRAGAGASALTILRRGWHVQNTIAITRNQDLVHRVVGRPGVILVGEGNPNRVRNLLTAEKKKHARVVGETPIYDIVVGDDTSDDQMPVDRLVKHIQKLQRVLSPADITDLLQRLKALDAIRPTLPVPKGPMPTTPRQARAVNRQSLRGR